MSNKSAFDFASIRAGVKKVNEQTANFGKTDNLVKMENIILGENVRKHMDEKALQGLAASIKSYGQQTAISIRKHPELEGKWLLVTGARRYRAMQMLGKTEIKAIVDEGLDIRGQQLIENIQREDMNPLDLGIELQAYMEENNYTQEELAERIGMSRRWVQRVTSVVKLPSPLQDLCAQGVLSDFIAIDDLARLLKKNPDWETWIIEEIHLAQTKAEKERKEKEANQEEVAPFLVGRTLVRELAEKLESKIKIRKKGKDDHSELWPMTDKQPLTLANASKLKKMKGYENYHFNGVNARMNCVFKDPDEFGDSFMGYEEDPLKHAQLTTISTNDPEIGIVEYKNQLFEVKMSHIHIVKILPITPTGRIRKMPKKE